jgi:glucose-1-phosphate thymidylyltransferase
LIEKPENPNHNLAVPGLYFFDDTVVERARKLKKSERGEYEIVDLLQSYADEERLTYTELSRGTAWLDTGSPEDLFNAGEFVRVIQQRQGSFIACLEEIAFRNGWISSEILESQQKKMEKSAYGNYLLRLIGRKALH